MSSEPLFSGSMVALITPFRDGEVDLPKLKELTDFHRRSGTSAVAPLGTTGEGGVLSREERAKALEAVREAAGEMKVIAGVGTNSTRKTIQSARIAAEAGADALLVVTPYYNKPTPAGLRAHYAAGAESTSLPLILYNVPSRTGLNLSVDVAIELSKIPTIVAIKEASGDLDQISQILSLTDLWVLSGDDALTWPIMQLGGVGVISVAANIIPREMRDLCRAAAEGDADTARRLHVKYHKLFKTIFIETNPVPIKAAMRHMGMIESDEMRLPLTPIAESNDEKLVEVLRAYSLL